MQTLSIMVGFLALSRLVLSPGNYEAFASRTYFYVGGHYENITLVKCSLLSEADERKLIAVQPNTGSGERYTEQIYVERLTPQYTKQKVPLVFIPGAGQTSTNFLNTPDGREGWASYFLNKGYTIYLTDVPQRGRSPWILGEGSTELVSAEYVEKWFTASERWPGTGRVGDPIFDAFYASQVQLQRNITIADRTTKSAYTALLEKIGPAVLVTHSQSGPYGWAVADARPDLVKGIIAIEPEGPPFVNETGPTGPVRIDGVTRLPLLYDPPVQDIATDLKTIIVPPPPGKNYTSCTIQAEPARKLVNLAKIPVILLTGEVSFHAPYDYCFVKYFAQTSVPFTWLDLGREGLHGNGHFLFMEKNNLQIAERVLAWLSKNIECRK